LRHVHSAREYVLEEYDLADGSRGNERLGFANVFDIAELRRHREHESAQVRGGDHFHGGGRGNGERLFTQNVQAAFEQVAADLAMRRGRRANDDRVQLRAVCHRFGAVEGLTSGSRGHLLSCCEVAVSNGGKLRAVRLREGLGISLGDGAGAYESKAYGF
jgi:hypothetical protein